MSFLLWLLFGFVVGAFYVVARSLDRIESKVDRLEERPHEHR